MFISFIAIPNISKYHHNIQHHSIPIGYKLVPKFCVLAHRQLEFPYMSRPNGVSLSVDTTPWLYDSARSSVWLSCLRSNIEPRIPWIHVVFNEFLLSQSVSLWVFSGWGCFGKGTLNLFYWKSLLDLKLVTILQTTGLCTWWLLRRYRPGEVIKLRGLADSVLWQAQIH